MPAEIVLWGDGRHDDTKALNAWLRGQPAIWGDSGEPVGAAIAGRRFRLSAAIYVPGGTGRSLEDFRLLWPERGEIVAGGDPGEGKPFETPAAAPSKPDPKASCAIS